MQEAPYSSNTNIQVEHHTTPPLYPAGRTLVCETERDHASFTKGVAQPPWVWAALSRLLLAHREAAVYLLCFAAATWMAWSAGAFQSEFAGYPDEPAHYITSLMIRDYIAGGFPAPPVRFAEDYYFHYPKVAFGHWPPVFHVMQAIWMLLFGESRASVLLLVAGLTSCVAFVLYRTIKRFFGVVYGLGAAVLFLLLPVVRVQTTTVMAEPALALFGLLAILTFARYLERPAWPAALCFALWASLAIMTKGDGLAFLVVVPVALLFSSKPVLFADRRLGIAAILIALACAPFMLLTFRMARQGWVSDFSVAYSAQAILAETRIVLQTFGPGLVMLAVAGAAAILPWTRRPERLTCTCLAAYVFGIIVFQALVPTGVEPRKLMMAFPAVLFLAVAGAKRAAELLRSYARPVWTAAVLLLLASAAWARTAYVVVTRPQSGYKAVAQYIISEPALRHAVILVSDNDPSLGEGVLIAEIASREARPGHYILRATKTIAHCDWTGTKYQLLYKDPKEVVDALDAIPVNLVVAEYPAMAGAPPHHGLLLNALEQYPDRWRLRYTGTDPAHPGGVRQIRVYQANRPVQQVIPKLKLDLSETLGRMLQAPASSHTPTR